MSKHVALVGSIVLRVPEINKRFTVTVVSLN